MPGAAGPNVGFVYGYSVNDIGWGITAFNPNFRVLDTIFGLEVISRVLAAPPGSPVAGDRYIIAGSPTGAWAGHAGDIGRWNGSAWEFVTPKSGWRARDRNASGFIYHTGTSWAEEHPSITYADLPAEVQNLPVAFLFSEKPVSGQKVIVPIVQVTTIPANFVGTIGYFQTLAAAPADFVLSLIHAGTITALGTVTFTGSSNLGTLSNQGSIVIPAGDMAMLEAPIVQDSSLANGGVTFMFKKG